ncbi:MAG: type II CRISPR RNA-guided endonuclease Cas9 [Acetobacteraceae bacterium]
MRTRYRLGLDLGANSIGWSAVSLDGDGRPSGLLDLGVRVYPDGRNPKDSSSLAAERRGPRSMRRNRDRYLRRRHVLLNALTRFGLMPDGIAARQAVATRDPYALRVAALHRRLAPEELGRVLFHINQHRGFKSNRKVDRASNEGGVIRDAAERTSAELARSGHPTIGSWLADRHEKHLGVRVRLAGSGKTAAYPFYPTRAMVLNEFETIWTAQRGWNPGLSDAMRDMCRAIIFFQRPLKSPPVGKCWLEPGELRAARALPTAQRARIAQTLAHLRLSAPGLPERPLAEKERATLSALLYRGTELPLDRVRKLLGLATETDFNTREKALVGCNTAHRLGGKKLAGAEWHALDLAAQDAAVLAILEAESDEQAIEALQAAGLSAGAAARAAMASLADGHAALSAVALGKILPKLERGLRYDEAVQAAGYRHHSDTRTGEIRERLPYYGELLHERVGTGSGEPADPEEKRFGKAPNPTVHVALNEVRRVVNAIIERLGAPAEIVVETLRDLGRSKKQREEYESQQKKNRAANDWRRSELTGMGLRVNGANLMRLRLWEEQAFDPKNRVCPYTGTLITPRTALSDAIEEDHILPFSVTLDDGAANRVLVTRDANRVKAKRAPHEAFGHTKEWPAILERVALLPQQKRWRFQPEAQEKFAREGDFLARHLTDSSTIARWATAYLEVLAPGKVWSTPGRLTSLLRHALGLSPATVLGKGGVTKTRDDHRHHAIDAVVVSLIDRGLLKRTTDAAKLAEQRGERHLVALDPPWTGFVEDVRARLATVVVSHKPDTGWQAALHNDTAYGPIRDAGATEPNVVVRRPIEALAKWSAEDATLRVRDPVLGKKIAAVLAISDPAARKAALVELHHSGDAVVRGVRTVERLDSRQPIADRRTGKPYKLVKRDGNHRAELWRLPSGAVKLIVVATFDAARQAEAARLGRPVPDLRPHPAARLLMRLHKSDLIGFGTGEQRWILRVVKMSEGKVTLAAHQEAGNLKARDATKDDPFKYVYASASRLLTEQARKLFVTPDGRVLAGSARIT